MTTKTQEIVALVQAGTHRIESYAGKRGTVYELRRWRADLGYWNRVVMPSICVRQAAKQLTGRYIVTLGCMHYTAA